MNKRAKSGFVTLLATFLLVGTFAGPAQATSQKGDTESGFTVAATVAPTLNAYGEEIDDQAATTMDAATTETRTCGDGSPPAGVVGYQASSGCARQIAVLQNTDCTASHSDTPGNSSTDTLTVTCDNPRCLERDLFVKVYVPADLPNTTEEMMALLKEADYEENRGWKVAQMTLKQTIGSDGTTVTEVEGYAKKAVTSTAGALGVTVTPGEVTNYVLPNGQQGVSAVNFNLALSNPFGDWSPNLDYNLEIRTNANGAPSAYSPAPGSGNDPPNGIYVGKRQRVC